MSQDKPPRVQDVPPPRRRHLDAVTLPSIDPEEPGAPPPRRRAPLGLHDTLPVPTEEVEITASEGTAEEGPDEPDAVPRPAPVETTLPVVARLPRGEDPGAGRWVLLGVGLGLLAVVVGLLLARG